MVTSDHIIRCIIFLEGEGGVCLVEGDESRVVVNGPLS